jgi:ABC-type multidrug transport system fused ATPase/permease subunit
MAPGHWCEDHPRLSLLLFEHLVTLNPFLAIISLIPAPFIIFFVKKLTRCMASGFDVPQKTFSGLTERVKEAFTGIRVTKAVCS